MKNEQSLPEYQQNPIGRHEELSNEQWNHDAVEEALQSLENLSGFSPESDPELVETPTNKITTASEQLLPQPSSAANTVPSEAPQVDFGDDIVKQWGPPEVQGTQYDLYTSSEIASEAGNQSEANKDNRSVFGTAMKTLEWLARPITSFNDASLAPITHPFTSETTFGKIGEAFEVSAKAWFAAAVPKYGSEVPMYGRKVADQILPNSPEWVRSSAGLALEILGDPSFAVGALGHKVIQAGLRISANKGAKSTAGIMVEGLNEIFGLGRGFDLSTEAGRGAALISDKLTDAQKTITEMAVQIDNGTADPKMIKEFLRLTEKDDAIRAGTDILEMADADSWIREAENMLGFEDGLDSEELIRLTKQTFTDEDLGKSLTSNGADAIATRVEINIGKTTAENLEGSLNEALDILATEYDDLIRVQPHAETIAASQKVQLTDLLGMQVQEMAPRHTYALRQLLVSSADELFRLGLATEQPGAGTIHFLKFEKAAAIHRLIQAKATGAASAAGRGLNAFSIQAGSSSSRVHQLQRILERLC